MKLYESERAPNPRRVRIFLAEKGIEVPRVQLDLAKLEHRSDPYRSLNPAQRVPALELDDGTVIAESMAICRYFEATNPSPPLFGKGAKEQAVVEMWNRQVEFNLLASIAAVFRHTHPYMAPMEVPQVLAWGEANRDKASDFLKRLDGELGKRPFVAGDSYSVADITALTAIDFMRLPKVAMPEGLDNVRRWHETVSARPSAKA